VAESVTDRAASDCHSVSSLSWMMTTWPGSDRMTCAIVGHAGLAPRRGERQRRADDVEQPVGIAEQRFDRDAGQHALVGAGDDDVAAGGEAPGRNQPGQQALQMSDGGRAILPDGADAVETLGEQIGDGGEVALDGRAGLPVLVDHLHERAETDGDQEGDDQGRHGTAKRRLRYQQPVIGRFCDRLRQSLDRIGLDARARRVCARHAFSPLGITCCSPLERTPGPFRITAI